MQIVDEVRVDPRVPFWGLEMLQAVWIEDAQKSGCSIVSCGSHDKGGSEILDMTMKVERDKNYINTLASWGEAQCGEHTHAISIFRLQFHSCSQKTTHRVKQRGMGKY